ncbi:hypothetical protein [Dokdonella fugitiva]|jgi:hypothetical protein|uniref:Uncharacterized protein n=1 Tax=Dokdonella fugitiva TaxID=328517 RepID=A0A4R2IAN4_9GAMM|nr:hypothetical protein [Dokdonella fugitiva]MBA8883422.1 hypothetical protein [Dokdonella fugitiva]TCO40739.1 hypothetical protein EV148_104100 [Dokdonella fugitiva]
MNSQLPIEGQKIQVKLRDGEWQDAVYRNDDFIDVYGLPLSFNKILAWRPASSNANAHGKPSASLH